MTTKTKKKARVKILPKKATTKKTPKTSKEDVRVQVAKDVLKQLASGKFETTHSDYLNIILDDNFTNDIGDNDSLQKVVKNPNTTCEVCALGACIVSYANLKNKVLVKEGYDARDSKTLDKVFGKVQKGLIESAYETSQCLRTQLDEELYDFENKANSVLGDIEDEFSNLTDFDTPSKTTLISASRDILNAAKVAAKKLESLAKESPDYNRDLEKRAINFGLGYSDSEERLKAIMKNIIHNKGVFKP